ncbi:MAG: aminotransferase class V-fold PLP-dependent enzyme [Candidatus Thermoplasmatota archaeon]|jgi:glutamate/tyrosine decarboxylase-like PLP-dependent enzyme|nr:aminotransferase class V-fold PLP-dependent enzyme [Candidatus Thermoplasmatota archaeon]
MPDIDLQSIMAGLEARLKPFGKSSEAIPRLPVDGMNQDAVLGLIRGFTESENLGWTEGKVSGAVYNGGEKLQRFLEGVYSAYSQTNGLHADIWPSLTKFQNEIVSMCSGIMHGDEHTRGAVTSGGTESILLAMKTYRDHYRKTKGITEPEIIIPSSAHAAFLKACDYFCMKPVIVKLDENFTADTEQVKEKLSKNTVAIVGSMPSFPFGTFDPIGELSNIARENEIGMHVDACLGGFIDPWARELGYPIPDFDFDLPGVTSISMDTHKYGYAPKGTSVILYRNGDLFQEQIYATGNWQGGIYFTPTMAGSRPGYPIAAAWAVMVTMGERGYREAAKKILETGKYIIG